MKEQIFDIHTHLNIMPGLDEEVITLARQRNMPIAISCLGAEDEALVTPTTEQCRRANDLVIELAQANPGLVYGYCYVNPLEGESAVEEIRRCMESKVIYGIKLWIAVKCSEPCVYPIAEEAIAFDIPILQHTWTRIGGNFPGESYPSDVRELALKYPQAKIIMAHLGFYWKDGVAAAKGCPNVWVDTCGFDPEAGSIELAVENLGAERVLYGSDAPIRDVYCQIGKIKAARISEEAKERILFRNALEILRIDQ